MPCWPDTYNCYVSFCPYCSRSGSTSFDSQSGPTASSATTEIFNARMSGASSRRLDKLGKFLQTAGAAQIAASPYSMPASARKIWVPMSRRDAFTHAPHLLDNSRKYDWRPKGESINWETKNSPAYDTGTKKLRGREAHWARRPKYNQGIYSQPTSAEIYHHRRSQSRKGKTKFAGGTVMRGLGKGFLAYQLGTYAYWMYDDPSESTVTKIVKDLTLSEQIEDMIVDPIMHWLNPEPLTAF